MNLTIINAKNVHLFEESLFFKGWIMVD